MGKSVAVVTCKVCDSGTMKKRRKHRLAGPAVFIGYLILIPSVIGILAGILALATMGGAAGEVTQSMRSEVRASLDGAGVPSVLQQKIMAMETISDEEMAGLSSSQRAEVQAAKLTMAGGTIGAGIGAVIGGGVALGVIVSSLFGGLLGWILTMKKKVLQCVNCGAVVQAS